MRTRTGWLALLLTAGVVGTAGLARGQEVPPADPVWPLPLYHDRPETGGFFAGAEFVYWRQTNPLKNQVVAFRGFMDTDGQLQAARNFLVAADLVDPNSPAFGLPELPVIPGAFFGSGAPALDVEQVAGPVTYQPSLGLTLGWRFGDGTAVALTWRHMPTVRYSAVASVIPPNFFIGRNGEDQFLFSPVFGFPPDFAGPVNKLAVVDPRGGGINASINTVAIAGQGGGPGQGGTGGQARVIAQATSVGSVQVPQAAYGIWNAATIMHESFVQRHDQWDLYGRIPIFQDDCKRWYALVGGRAVWFWERYEWRTIAVEAVNPGQSVTVTVPGTTVTGGAGAPSGTAGGAGGGVTITGGSITVTGAGLGAPALASPEDVAIYSNVVSNRLYGPMCGCGTEWYLGHGFAISLDLRAAFFVDVVKERAKYERQDKAISHGRSRTEYTLVPELDAIGNIWWYPIEGVQLNFGYDVMTFFNTISSPRPVDFNYGAVAPAWEKGTFRMVDGFHAGLGLIF